MKQIKIDEALVRNMHSVHEDMQINKTILLLAQSLEMEVFAEGIETEEQFEVLRASRCEFGQSYYFAKPMDPEEAVVKLMSQTKWSTIANA